MVYNNHSTYNVAVILAMTGKNMAYDAHKIFFFLFFFFKDERNKQPDPTSW